MEKTTTTINKTQHKEQPVPEVGKEYHIFDDGKIKPSSHYTATIVEVIPFEKCEDLELMSKWADEVIEYYWLFATATDYFVKAVSNCNKNPLYFVRTTNGGWFSLGFFRACLDIDGSLYNKMIDQVGEEN